VRMSRTIVGGLALFVVLAVAGVAPAGGAPTKDYRVVTEAMAPALPVGSKARVLLRGFELERGAVYLVHPNGKGPIVEHVDHAAEIVSMERLVGLPGDWVRAVDGHVQICTGPHATGCKTLREPYVSSRQVGFGPIHVPAGHYFLLGDNRESSDDSRDWGAIRSAQFVGRFTKLVKR
jgi:signal peptidase I